MSGDWHDVALSLRAALTRTMRPHETVESGDVFIPVGITGVEVIIEIAEVEGHDQETAFSVLAGLLSDRHAASGNIVMGLLLLPIDPDLDAFTRSLADMGSPDGAFSPIVPMARDQAQQLAANEADMYEILNDAVELLEIAVSRPLADRANAASEFVEEFATLVERHAA